MSLLKGKTAFITGGSRGIGKAIALRLAAEGVNIALVAKTAEPHPKLEGTIFTAADEVRGAGVEVLPFALDIRDEAAVERAMAEAAERLGGIDLLINNASAISLTGTEATEPKRYDLMHDINVRGTFFTSRAALPYLRRSAHAHILNLSPPLDLQPKWFAPHLAYTMSKFGMSLIVLGLSEELRAAGIGVNALWPRTTIATAAVRNILGGDALIRMSRHPAIVADAAAAILSRSPKECTGNFFIDEEVLRAAGITDFTRYAVDPSAPLQPDLFLEG